MRRFQIGKSSAPRRLLMLKTVGHVEDVVTGEPGTLNLLSSRRAATQNADGPGTEAVCSVDEERRTMLRETDK